MRRGLCSLPGGERTATESIPEPSSPRGARPAFCWLATTRADGFAACRINTMFVLRNGFQQDMVNINSQVGQMHNSSPSTLRRLCLSHD